MENRESIIDALRLDLPTKLEQLADREENYKAMLVELLRIADASRSKGDLPQMSPRSIIDLDNPYALKDELDSLRNWVEHSLLRAQDKAATDWLRSIWRVSLRKLLLEKANRPYSAFVRALNEVLANVIDSLVKNSEKHSYKVLTNRRKVYKERIKRHFTIAPTVLFYMPRSGLLDAVYSALEQDEKRQASNEKPIEVAWFLNLTPLQVLELFTLSAKNVKMPTLPVSPENPFTEMISLYGNMWELRNLDYTQYGTLAEVEAFSPKLFAVQAGYTLRPALQQTAKIEFPHYGVTQVTKREAKIMSAVANVSFDLNLPSDDYTVAGIAGHVLAVVDTDLRDVASTTYLISSRKPMSIEWLNTPANSYPFLAISPIQTLLL